MNVCEVYVYDVYRTQEWKKTTLARLKWVHNNPTPTNGHNLGCDEDVYSMEAPLADTNTNYINNMLCSILSYGPLSWAYTQNDIVIVETWTHDS